MIRKGSRNLISDVAGVTVGHYTVDEPRHHTGVTVILPAPQEPFLFTNKLIAAGAVLNGYGKTQGLIQIDELGTLETPIALTNTLNIGKVHDALVQYMADEAKRRGVKLRSVNPVVGECNDSALNEITERVIEKEHVFAAIKSAGPEFALGDVGAGKGTTCFGLKGGIGSASRVFTVGEETYTLGVLVQSNFGEMANLRVDGEPIGREVARKLSASEPDKGSVMIVVATDMPVTARQLKRILRRAGVGLARLGSFWGHGSGDIVIGFSTAQRLREEERRGTVALRALNEEYINIPFEAMADATEEAVLRSMLEARPVGNRRSLSEFVKRT